MAARVLNQEGLQLDGATLEMSRHMVSATAAGTHSESKTTDALSSPAHLDTIEVKGIPPSAHQDYVKLFFESPRSGGGPVKQMELAGSQAIITFENPEGRCLKDGEALLEWILRYFLFPFLHTWF